MGQEPDVMTRCGDHVLRDRGVGVRRLHLDHAGRSGYRGETVGVEAGQLLTLKPSPPSVRADQSSLFGILSAVANRKMASRQGS